MEATEQSDTQQGKLASADSKVAPAEKRWISTYTGVRFFPLEPRHCDVVLEDIAHALSRVNRYTGHIEFEHYNVAEHSVHVSWEVERRAQGWPSRQVRALALWGLLHDATEAYIADVSRPLKRLPAFEQYREAEHRLMQIIAERFGLLPGGEPELVKTVDTEILANEMLVLLPRCDLEAWEAAGGPTKPIPAVVIEGWTPNQAKERFLTRFEALTHPVFK